MAKRFGGVILARGGHPPQMAGSDVRIVGGSTLNPDQRHVVIRFPSFEQVQAYWNSEDYAPLKALRASGTATEGLMIDAPDPEAA